MSPSRPRFSRVRNIFPSASRAESIRVTEILRKETVGGILLVIFAAIALIWANSPWAESYFAIRDFEIGY